MKAVSVICALAAAFALLAGFLVATGAGIAWLVTLISPSIEWGHAIIAGCIASVAATFLLIKTLGSIKQHGLVDDNDEDDDDNHVLVLPRDIISHLPHLPHRPRTRKKPR